MRIKAVHALFVVSCLALAALYVASWTFPRSTEPLIPRDIVPTAGKVWNQRFWWSTEEKVEDDKETELEELLQILKSRQDKYTGPILRWQYRRCNATTQGNTPCFDATCPRQFPPSLRERLKQVLSVRTPLPEKYMQALASVARPVTSHKYIFVTGASSNHYYEMQALLRTVFDSLLPRMKGEDYALVVYNLGFTEEQKKLTEKNCHCKVLDFPFSAIPEFFRHLKCYVWKPLIMASLLEKAEYLTWMDASIRFRDTDPFPQMFQKARDNGYQARSNKGSLAVRTRTSMADFFGDHLCQYSYFSEIENNFFVLYNDRFMRDAIMKPWLSCAFTKNCICIRNHTGLGGTVYAHVHRYDQSSMGMIFSKLYLEKRSMLHVHNIKIDRSSKMNWFKSQP